MGEVRTSKQKTPQLWNLLHSVCWHLNSTSISFTTDPLGLKHTPLYIKGRDGEELKARSKRRRFFSRDHTSPTVVRGEV